jgi:hypothetical protein
VLTCVADSLGTGRKRKLGRRVDGCELIFPKKKKKKKNLYKINASGLFLAATPWFSA